MIIIYFLLLLFPYQAIGSPQLLLEIYIFAFCFLIHYRAPLFSLISIRKSNSILLLFIQFLLIFLFSYNIIITSFNAFDNSLLALVPSLYYLSFYVLFNVVIISSRYIPYESMRLSLLISILVYITFGLTIAFIPILKPFNLVYAKNIGLALYAIAPETLPYVKSSILYIFYLFIILFQPVFTKSSVTILILCIIAMALSGSKSVFFVIPFLLSIFIILAVYRGNYKLIRIFFSLKMKKLIDKIYYVFLGIIILISLQPAYDFFTSKLPRLQNISISKVIQFLQSSSFSNRIDELTLWSNSDLLNYLFGYSLGDLYFKGEVHESLASFMLLRYGLIPTLIVLISLIVVLLNSIFKRKDRIPLIFIIISMITTMPNSPGILHIRIGMVFWLLLGIIFSYSNYYYDNTTESS